MKAKLLSVLTLFGSTGTLICCVLPAVVASIAGGAAVAAMVSTFPFLITLSQYKGWIFLVAGLLIVLNWVLVRRPQSALACSITGGDCCEITGRFSSVMLTISIVIYLIGAFFSYALVPVLVYLGVF